METPRSVGHHGWLAGNARCRVGQNAMIGVVIVRAALGGACGERGGDRHAMWHG